MCFLSVRHCATSVESSCDEREVIRASSPRRLWKKKEKEHSRQEASSAAGAGEQARRDPSPAKGTAAHRLVVPLSTHLVFHLRALQSLDTAQLLLDARHNAIHIAAQQTQSTHAASTRKK